MLLLIRLADEVPKDDDVVAGFWGALMFVLLIIAVTMLILSFLKRMRNVRANRDAGMFDEEPRNDAPPEAPRP